MNPDEVLAASLAPGTKSVYFLGCFESRVTVYAQQVRAINLAAALVSEGMIRSKGKVAVIGGGAAGMTATAALVSLCPELQKVMIFEKKPDLLHMQLQCHDRYLHPHVYDWPRTGSQDPHAGLPILDWAGGSADVVAKTLIDRFRPFSEVPYVEVRTSTAVSGLSLLGTGSRVLLADGRPEPTVFDAVIISVGFGYEKFTDLGQSSYWNPSQLSQPIRNNVTDPLLFVSGNGDGALVDFSLAAYQHIPHVDLCGYFMDKDGLDSAKSELLAVEAEAEVTGDSFDLFEAYRTRVAPLIPTGILLDIHERLRTDAKVRFHTRSTKLFRRDTSILNRFIAFLAIHVDEVNNPGAQRIEVTTGKPIPKPEYAADGSVEIENEARFTPYVRLLRFGAESDEVMKPFGMMANEARQSRKAVENTHANATPILTASAKAQFDAVRTDNRFQELTKEQLEQNMVATSVLQLELRRNGNEIRWNHSSIDSFDLCWSAQMLEVRCDFIPQDCPALAMALMRVLAHAKASTLIVPNPEDWNRTWRTLVKRTPSFHTRYSQPLLKPTTSAMHVVQTSHVLPQGEFTEELHRKLDRLTAAQLDIEVTACLSELNPQNFGWEIAAPLRSELRNLWHEWLAELLASPERLKRFLLLMVDSEDSQDLQDNLRLQVGQLSVVTATLRSTLFALHVALGLPDLLGPNAEFPGNLASHVLRTHACGVSWLDGIDIEASCRHANWQSKVVLLSELRSTSSLTNRLLPRLTELESDQPSLLQNSAIDAPIILGSDDGFRTAAFSGRQQLAAHFSAIFERHTEVAENSLER